VLAVARIESDPMSRNTLVSLGDHFAEFVDQQIDSDRYSSASDVVRAGLRLLEEQQAQIEALRAALIEGETSGAATAAAARGSVWPELCSPGSESAVL
jgi:antitoxin ParD1/3/4